MYVTVEMLRGKPIGATIHSDQASQQRFIGNQNDNFEYAELAGEIDPDDTYEQVDKMFRADKPSKGGSGERVREMMGTCDMPVRTIYQTMMTLMLGVMKACNCARELAITQVSHTACETEEGREIMETIMIEAFTAIPLVCLAEQATTLATLVRRDAAEGNLDNWLKIVNCAKKMVTAMTAIGVSPDDARSLAIHNSHALAREATNLIMARNVTGRSVIPFGP